jgi:hypothetical protein
MQGFFNAISTTSNLYFLASLLGAIVICYVLSLIFRSLQRPENALNPLFSRVINMFADPLFMLILTTGYGIGYNFLVLPTNLAKHFVYSLGILLTYNIAWFIHNAVRLSIMYLVAQKRPDIAGFIMKIVKGVLLIVVITIDFHHLIALIYATIITFIFWLIIRCIFKPTPRLIIEDAEKTHPQVIVSHIYLSSHETHNTVKRAIAVISDTLSDVKGIIGSQNVLLNSFKQDAFDILVSYKIENVEKAAEVRQYANLAILKALNEENIEIRQSRPA